MKVEEIPSNELVIMTPELYQEFCQAGCVPMCHLTQKWINMGDLFQLATTQVAVKAGSAVKNKLETRDVMLAEGSSLDEFNQIQVAIIEKHENHMVSRKGGCFRVNGKIVI